LVSGSDFNVHSLETSVDHYLQAGKIDLYSVLCEVRALLLDYYFLFTTSQAVNGTLKLCVPTRANGRQS
tara:strand:- start:29391 stop:29597 length:207 start_codon:yes stop_codon:yes gene_type:complete